MITINGRLYTYEELLARMWDVAGIDLSLLRKHVEREQKRDIERALRESFSN